MSRATSRSRPDEGNYALEVGTGGYTPPRFRAPFSAPWPAFPARSPPSTSCATRPMSGPESGAAKQFRQYQSSGRSAHRAASLPERLLSVRACPTERVSSTADVASLRGGMYSERRSVGYRHRSHACGCHSDRRKAACERRARAASGRCWKSRSPAAAVPLRHPAGG